MPNTTTATAAAKTTNSSVTWASSSPFDVPAYVTGEWGEYVTSLDGPTFDADKNNAMILTPAEQRAFAATHQGPMRFRASAEFDAVLQRADDARGF